MSRVITLTCYSVTRDDTDVLVSPVKYYTVTSDDDITVSQAMTLLYYNVIIDDTCMLQCHQ